MARLPDEPVDRFSWERAVRALPIRPPVRKLVALVLATYANKDGTNAHPGEKRLASDCGITTRSVREHLSALSDSPRRPGIGLIFKTFEGGQAGRQGKADEYYLTLPPDVISRVDRANDAHAHSRLPAADLRHERSGGITGTDVPDHRHQGTERRNVDVRSSGTTVPPTKTDTKEADHASPTSTSVSNASTDPSGRHVFIDDGSEHHDCKTCSFPERYRLHVVTERRTA